MNKVTNGEGNNPSRDSWQTPQWLFDKLNEQYGFEFDCCASQNNAKCEKYSNNFESVNNVHPVAWMNPPFSKAAEMFTHFFTIIRQGVAIYRCDNMETDIWQDIIFPNVDWIFIPKRRIKYEGQPGKGGRFPSALIGLNMPMPEGLDGTLLVVYHENDYN